MLHFIKLLSLVLLSLAVFSSCEKEIYPYNLDDHIKVCDIPVDFTVSEEEIFEMVSEQIEEVRKNNSINSSVADRPAAEGDIVNVSLVCYPTETYKKENSVPIQKLSDPDCTMILGNNKYPSEIEKQIMGMRINDTTVAYLTYSENFSLKEFANTSVVFEITVNSITEVKLPLYNDIFVRSVSNCQTVEEYENFLFDRIKEDIIWDYMMKNSEVILYPSDELNRYSSDFTNYYSDLATGKNITLEEYVSKKFFMELADFHIKTDNYAKEMVKSDLLLYSLVGKYSLQLTDEEYTAGAEYYANLYGIRSVSLLEGKFGSEFVRKSVQKDKVLSFLSKSVSVTPIAEDIN